MSLSPQSERSWLLLFHQIPPKPNYFRVKIWRRLQKLGAVAVKNSIYVLPKSDQGQEDFQWVLREIVEGGGEATLCEARLVEGLTDQQIEELFRAARSADYRQLADDCRRIAKNLSPRRADKETDGVQANLELERLQRRLAEVVAIDFFGAPGQAAAQGLVTELESRLRGMSDGKNDTVSMTPSLEYPRGRTWVTRQGIHVDRMASAWLIRRFIDAEARFKFVPAKGYKLLAGELRFDMFDAEFTHEGDRCTFEILLRRFALTDKALHTVAEIVHDIDLKDQKFARQETVGMDHLIAGIAMGHKDDAARLERAAAVFDDLYEYFKNKRA
ncbi:MAG TPA: chromate resistance protein ChrB domain-containing protein [Candidatus Limnocylindria bacterium]|nr:chromate resistance protein ChrB domain-containing protein [Candidatus Limnocylindria bacterium]